MGRYLQADPLGLIRPSPTFDHSSWPRRSSLFKAPNPYPPPWRPQPTPCNPSPHPSVHRGHRRIPCGLPPLRATLPPCRAIPAKASPFCLPSPSFSCWARSRSPCNPAASPSPHPLPSHHRPPRPRRERRPARPSARLDRRCHGQPHPSARPPPSGWNPVSDDLERPALAGAGAGCRRIRRPLPCARNPPWPCCRWMPAPGRTAGRGAGLPSARHPFPTLSLTLSSFGIDPSLVAGLVTQSGSTGALRLSTLPEEFRAQAAGIPPGPREAEADHPRHPAF